MKKIESRLKSYLKGKRKVTEALVVLFLITGGIGYGETIKKSERLKKEAGIIKEIAVEREINFTSSNGKDNIRVRIRMQENNIVKENLIFKEIIKQTEEKNPRNLDSLLEQIYYKNSNLTINQWSKRENIEIIEFVVEECNMIGGILLPLGALGIIGAVVATNQSNSDAVASAPEEPDAVLPPNPEEPTPTPTPTPIPTPDPEEPTPIPDPEEPTPPLDTEIVEVPVPLPPLEEDEETVGLPLPPLDTEIVEVPVPLPPLEEDEETVGLPLPPLDTLLPFIWENGVSVGDNVTEYEVGDLDAIPSGVVGIKAIGSHMIEEKTRVSIFGDMNVGESTEDLSLIQVGTERIGAQALNGAEITNKGLMTVGHGSLGMQALATNDPKWLETIDIYGDTTDITSVINEGNIYGDGAKVGMLSSVKKTEAKNSGMINGTFLVAAMVAADGGMALNTEEGTIENNGISGMTALGTESIAKNQGAISNYGTVANTVGYGMYAKDAGTVINDGTVTYAGTNKLFETMYVTGDQSTGLNTGEISNTGDFAARADGEGALITNEGKITFRRVGLAAVNGATVINEKDATIVSDNVNWWATAIRSDGVGSLAINYGTIMSPAIVMEAMGGGMAINYADISGNIMQVLAASGTTDVEGAPKGTMINFGKLTTNGDQGFLIEGGIGINNGTIAITGNEGMYIVADGTAVNGDNGIIENDGVAGIYINARLNQQNIYMPTRAENYGIIRNTGDFGVVVSGRNAIGINFKTVSNAGDYGMHAEAGGVVLNQLDGVIENSGQKKMSASGFAIYDSNPFWGPGKDDYDAHAINQGTINVNGDGGIGMYAENEGGISVYDVIVLNDVTGKIYLNGTNGIGMMANGAGAKIYNKGEIYLDLNGIDYGTIVTDNNSTFVDSKGNTAFKLTNGGALHNDGIITVLGAFDTDRSIAGDGTGKFVVEGGQIAAESIGGNYYASGALVTSNYSDVQNTYELFKTENMYGNIISNSAMYDAALTKDKNLDGYFGIEMTRKNFNDIIENSNFATYLENNYKEDGSTEERKNLYNAFKLQSTQEELNNASNQLSGNRIYPAFEYQTLSNIRGINNAIQSEMHGNTTKDDVRYIGFAKYKDSNVKMGGSVEDYTAKLSTVTLGMDKALFENVRVGVLGTVGKSDYDFDSNDTRKDTIYQGNLIGSYEKNGFVGTTSIFYGKTDGDIKRAVNFGTISSEMKGDLETEYYGANLGLQKRFEKDMFNITPRVELNITQMSQDSVNESATNGYAINVESVDSTSVESGIGFTVDKVIETGNGITITPSASLMYYRELGNPYKDANASLGSIGSLDSFKINGYDVDKNRGELSIAVKVKRNALEGSLGAEFKVDDQGNSVTPFVSVGYRF